MSALALEILEGRATLTSSAHQLWKLAQQLGLEEGDQIHDDLRLISSETDHLPLGEERELWDPKALKEKDVAIEHAENWARKFGLSTCRLIRERFPPRDFKLSK